MRPPTLLLAFAPLIVFSVLASLLPSGLIGAAALAAAVIALMAGQFAREVTPRAYWSSPVFRKANRVVSTGWGVAISAAGVSRVSAAAIGQSTSRRVPELLLGLIVPAAIILGALGFSLNVDGAP